MTSLRTVGKEEDHHVVSNSRYDLKGDFYFSRETRVKEKGPED